MNRNNGHEATPNDFFDVLKYIFSIIIKITAFFKEVLVKKIVLILCFSVIGIILAFLKPYIKKPSYKATMLVTQNAVSSKIFMQKIKVIEELIETKSYHALAEKLSVPYDQALSISDISISSLSNDSAKTGSYYIEAELNDNKILNTLQNGLMNYLNDFYYINELKKVERELNKEKIAYIDRQLAQLDSFKIIYAASMGHVNTGNINLMLNQNSTMSDLFNHSNAFINEKQSLYRNLESHTKIAYVLDNLSVSDKSNSNSLLVSAIKFFIVAFLIGYAIAVFIVLKNKMINYTS